MVGKENSFTHVKPQMIIKHSSGFVKIGSWINFTGKILSCGY